MQDELAEISIVTHKLVPNSSQNCNPKFWADVKLSSPPHPPKPMGVLTKHKSISWLATLLLEEH